jgi:hypothetical protein
MSNTFWLSEVQFAQRTPHLPNGAPGQHRVDDRRVSAATLR